jgi:uncharacterized lipoprotein YbaY
MRTITGKIILPPNVAATKADEVTIEVRDVSEADALSTVVAERRLKDVALKPNGEIKFKLSVPDVGPNRSLAMRVHVGLDGSGRVKSGDLLTTAHISVPNMGKAEHLEVPVVVI